MVLGDHHPVLQQRCNFVLSVQFVLFVRGFITVKNTLARCDFKELLFENYGMNLILGVRICIENASENAFGCL